MCGGAQHILISRIFSAQHGQVAMLLLCNFCRNQIEPLKLALHMPLSHRCHVQPIFAPRRPRFNPPNTCYLGFCHVNLTLVVRCETHPFLQPGSYLEGGSNVNQCIAILWSRMCPVSRRTNHHAKTRPMLSFLCTFPRLCVVYLTRPMLQDTH